MRYTVDYAAMGKQIAVAVRRLREARGWTQVDLAKAVGKDRTTIVAVENTKKPRGHDHRMIQAIADALQVRISEITGEPTVSDLSEDALLIAQKFDAVSDVEEKADLKRVFLRMLAASSSPR